MVRDSAVGGDAGSRVHNQMWFLVRIPPGAAKPSVSPGSVNCYKTCPERIKHWYTCSNRAAHPVETECLACPKSSWLTLCFILILFFSRVFRLILKASNLFWMASVTSCKQSKSYSFENSGSYRSWRVADLFTQIEGFRISPDRRGAIARKAKEMMKMKRWVEKEKGMNKRPFLDRKLQGKVLLWASSRCCLCELVCF